MGLTKIRQFQVKNLDADLLAIQEQMKTFKSPVALISDLPIENNNDGDLRVCLEDGNIYIWNATESEWSLSSGKGGSFAKTITVDVAQDNQTTINTGIRFDGTGTYQTNSSIINLFLNGMLLDSSCFTTANVDEELVITWIDSDTLVAGDKLGVQYYDTLLMGDLSGGKVDLSAYSTTEQMNTAIDTKVSTAIEAIPDVDLSSYSTTEQMNTAISSAIADIPETDLSAYSTTTQMNQAISDAIATVDLSAYSTTEEMTTAISQAIQGIDFSNYYTKTEVDNNFAKVVSLTQSEYDALETKDPKTIYVIV